MKKLKLGFAAIIAIAAVGLTIAVQAGTFESKVVLDETDCFRPAADVKIACADGVTTLTSSTLCEEANDFAEAGAIPGAHLFAINTVNSIPVGNIGVECPGDEVFCCLTVEVDPSPCGSPNQVQPQLNLGNGSKFYRIVDVFCELAQ